MTHMHVSRRSMMMAAGAAAITPAALAAQTPAATPVGQSGITWPEDQALPTFAEATSLTVANLDGLSDSEKVLFATLQGIVNRIEPRIYLEQPRDEGAYTWLNDGLGIPFEEIDDPWQLLEQFRDEVTGIVVTDDTITHTVNVATTIAGLQGGIVASPAQAERLTADPYGFKVLDDLRDRFTSNLEANQWQVENLWPHVSHRMLLGIDPEGVFADLRDYAIANTTMPFWLDVNVPEEQALFIQLMEDVEPWTPYLGWFSQDVEGEFSGTQLCSEHSVYVLAADWFSNMTVWSGTRAPDVTVQTVAPPPLENKIYVTFVVTEGDNLQYNQHRLRVLWEDEGRGTVPVNWTTNPLLIDAAPAMFAWFANSATENDHFMVGPSGAGYMNPGAWPEETLDRFTERTGHYMEATGMTTVYVLNRDEGEGIDMTDAEVESYIANANPKGVMLNWEDFTESKILTGGLPQTVVHQGGEVGEIQSAIATAAEGWDGASPMFLAMGVLAWDLTATDMAEIAGSLGEEYAVLRADQYFDLMRQHAEGTGTPGASPEASPAT